VCIILVVLWHTIMKHYLQISWHLGLPLPGAWGFLGDQLLPLRMPLFFTISGIFAVNAATRPWRSVLRSRVAKFYYLYLVWFVIHTAVLAAVPDFDTLHAATPLDVLEELTITPINLWYLVALAVYFVLAKATRGVNRWAILGPALALSVIDSAGWLATPGDRGGLYQNLIWFLVGFSFKPWVLRVADTATMKKLLASGGLYAALLAVMFVTRSQQWPGVWSVVSLSAVIFGLTGASMVGRLERVGALLARLGRNTLPIYLAHMPLLGLFQLMLLGPISRAGVGVQVVAALFEPVALTGVLVALSLLLRGALRRAHLGWLYALPEFGGRTPVPPGDPGHPGRHRAAHVLTGAAIGRRAGPADVRQRAQPQRRPPTDAAGPAAGGPCGHESSGGHGPAGRVGRADKMLRRPDRGRRDRAERPPG
jgi:uncharacterized membrane protein YcfT